MVRTILSGVALLLHMRGPPVAQGRGAPYVMPLCARGEGMA
jgi:hypothetical protein